MASTRMPEAVIGLDVGKSSHWACVATRDGEVLLSAPVANREGDLDSLFGRFPDALVVVDQSRNIGALALARARAAGMSAAYLPGLAAHPPFFFARGCTEWRYKWANSHWPFFASNYGP